MIILFMQNISDYLVDSPFWYKYINDFILLNREEKYELYYTIYKRY